MTMVGCRCTTKRLRKGLEKFTCNRSINTNQITSSGWVPGDGLQTMAGLAHPHTLSKWHLPSPLWETEWKAIHPFFLLSHISYTPLSCEEVLSILLRPSSESNPKIQQEYCQWLQTAFFFTCEKLPSFSSRSLYGIYTFHRGIIWKDVK